MSAWAWTLLVPPAVAWSVITLLLRTGGSRWLEDLPNARSLHVEPTPRLGGLGVLAGFVPFMAWHADRGLAVVLGCAIVLALVSLADDVRSLPVQVRLPAHMAAALAAVLALSLAEGGPSPWRVVVAVLAIVWLTNLFNFMDGADGLAGGMAAFGFGALAIAALDASLPLAFACAAIAAACVGFLAHNFPPARVFMGDAGSIPLGFLAGALALAGIERGAWPAWFPVLVFSPFIVDATVTLARRALRRERVWRAHRSHYYQRLVGSGWSHRRLALAAYGLMAACAASALAALRIGPGGRYAIIAAWAAIYVMVLFVIDRRAPFSGVAAQPPGGVPTKK
jgi:UDP-N-acetylmuramyl pentapeptide phosphotransferase/UDP-N-acetylglucosamine-1-phosphate transferase